MRFFLDTEFIENGPKSPIQLISIALVAENGSSYYDVSSEYDSETANDWVKANVLPHVEAWGDKRSLAEIADRVIKFVSGQGNDKPEFWGYYSDYDWVVFCQIFGSMVNLPSNWPMYCMDLKQWAVRLGNPTLPRQSSVEHNALNDARWNLSVYKFLYSLERTNELNAKRSQQPAPRDARRGRRIAR